MNLSSRRRRLPGGSVRLLEPEADRSGLVTIADSSSDDLDTLSLVLAAVGIDHFLDPDGGHLLVVEAQAHKAMRQISRFRRENAGWPPPPPPRQTLHPHSPPTLLIMGALALFFAHTGPWSASSAWFARGAVDREAIIGQGQWWRLVTALTLHADLVHLAGNCLIGGVMIHLLGRSLGYGLSWLLLLGCGAAGNLFNILLRQQPHLSIGLSTSVFAAIGMFTGLQLTRQGPRSLRALLVPLGAGAGLLAMLGSEGVRTDLGAHFFGFGCGIACGLALTFFRVPHRPWRPTLQAAFFSLSLGSVLLCWWLALR